MLGWGSLYEISPPSECEDGIGFGDDLTERHYRRASEQLLAAITAARGGEVREVERFACGHEKTPDNIRIVKKSPRCRDCLAAYERKRRADKWG